MAEHAEEDPIFLQFRKDREAMKKLQGAVISLKNEKYYTYPPLILRTLHIEAADATMCQSFSGAKIIVEHPDELLFTGGSVFRYGLDVLEGYLDDDCKLPKNDQMKTALGKLLQFLSSCTDHSELVSHWQEADEGECYWSLVLAEHLLSKLAVKDDYKLDHQYEKPSSMDFEERQKIREKFDDTSFGCSDGWHGSVDILMGNTLPVNVFAEDDITVTTSESSEEAKAKARDFGENDLSQLMTQTIVFSFLQKHGGMSNASLVPSVGISKDSLVVFFYDCDNDVLLHSTKMPLFTKHIGTLPIVFLWLALNYKLFCTGIVEEMKDGKAGFHSIAGPFLEKYKTEIKQPCNATAMSDEDIFDFDMYILSTHGTPIKKLHTISFMKPPQ